MTVNEICVNVSVANINSGPLFRSDVVTQALLGEKLTVIGQNGKWSKVKQWDGYEGWINEIFAVRPGNEYISNKNEIVINDLFANVYIDKSRSSSIIRDLVYGNTLKIVKSEGKWHKVILPDNKFGWIDRGNKPKKTNDLRTQLVKEAARFLGIQYLWGGKSSKGFDCSGFVQTVMNYGGIKLPRDAYQQEMFKSFTDINLSEAQNGDLIFFNNDGEQVDHVGIFMGGNDFIHASGFVKIENFNSDSPNFNEQLFNNIYSVKSIERYCN